MPHREERFNTKDGIEIFCQSWSPDTKSKAILVIAHGLGDHSGRYRHYVDYFVPRGYAVYGVDLRGHGRSGGRRGHVDRFGEYVDDVRQVHNLVSRSEPGVKVILLGHSLGALIALSYALRYPDGLAGVISSGTGMRDALDVPGWLRSMTGTLAKIAPKVALNNGVKTEYLSHDPAIVQAYDADPLVHHVGTIRLAAEVDIVRAELLSRAGEWKLPLLMLHGGDDRLCLLSGAQLLYDRLDHSLVEFRQYVGMYHEVHNEVGKEAVFKDVEEWLHRVAE